MFEIYSDIYGVKGTPEKPPEKLEPTPYLLTDVYLKFINIVATGGKDG